MFCRRLIVTYCLHSNRHAEQSPFCCNYSGRRSSIKTHRYVGKLASNNIGIVCDALIIRCNIFLVCCCWSHELHRLRYKSISCPYLSSYLLFKIVFQFLPYLAEYPKKQTNQRLKPMVLNYELKFHIRVALTGFDCEFIIQSRIKVMRQVQFNYFFRHLTYLGTKIPSHPKKPPPSTSFSDAETLPIVSSTCAPWSFSWTHSAPYSADYLPVCVRNPCLQPLLLSESQRLCTPLPPVVEASIRPLVSALCTDISLPRTSCVQLEMTVWRLPYL
jgi:hypothetical protein